MSIRLEAVLKFNSNQIISGMHFCFICQEHSPATQTPIALEAGQWASFESSSQIFHKPLRDCQYELAFGARISMLKNELVQLTPSDSGVVVLCIDDAIEFILREADASTRRGDFAQAQRFYQRVIKLTQGASKADRQKLGPIRERLAELNLTELNLEVAYKVACG